MRIALYFVRRSCWQWVHTTFEPRLELPGILSQTIHPRNPPSRPPSQATGAKSS